MLNLKHYTPLKVFFLFGLLLVLIGMSLSKFLMSMGQFILLASWLTEGNWKNKIHSIYHQ